MHQFQIADMTCKHCESSVTKAVKQVDPSAELKIDLSTHQVQIESTLERVALSKAISDAGFTPN